MSWCRANGIDVVSGTIRLPRVGVWMADLVVDGAGLSTGAVTIDYADGAIKLKGSTRFAGTSEGNGEAHILGGAAGLSTVVQGKSYRNVTRSAVISDILKAGGEVASQASDATWMNAQLPFWNTMRGTVGSELELIVSLQSGISWRVLRDGTFWFGPESWPDAKGLTFDLQRYNPRSLSIELDADVPQLFPGTVVGGQKVSVVEHHFDAKNRTCVVYFENPTS